MNKCVPVVKEYKKRITLKDGRRKIVEVKETILPANCSPSNPLDKYGYKNIVFMSDVQRQKALDKAYKGYKNNWIGLFKTLNYLLTINKSNTDMVFQLMKDKNYVRHKYGSQNDSRRL